MIDTNEIKFLIEKDLFINKSECEDFILKLCDAHDELKQELSKYADCIDGQWIPHTIEGSND